MRREVFTRETVLLTLPIVVGVLTLNHIGTAFAIPNGDDVKEGQYRFSVKFTMTALPTAEGGHRDSACSGALIDRQWVITAGHCFKDVHGNRVEQAIAQRTTVTVGKAHVTEGNGHEVGVAEVHQAASADVALVKLDAAITDIEPLRVGQVAPHVGDVVRFTGFGARNAVDPVSSKRMHTGQFTVVSLSPSITGVTGRAPHRYTSPCPFDSGGPFFSEADPAHPVLVSVVSDGPDCPHDQVERSARTDDIAGWIFQTIGKSTGVEASRAAAR